MFNLTRVLTLEDEELNKFKEGKIVSIRDIGNNFTNLSNKSKVKHFFPYEGFQMYKKKQNVVEIEVKVKNIILHQYDEDNIINYDEQECHLSEKQKFTVIDSSYNEEDDRFYIRLKALALALENEITLEEGNYYKNNDRLYLKEVKGMDHDEIEEILK